MLIVIPYCHKDRDQAQRLADWMCELGPFTDHEILVVRDRRAAPIPAFASVFKSHQELVVTDDVYGKWPDSANNAFKKAAKHIEYTSRVPWLWLEPDAVILRAIAFDEIEAEYKVALEAKKLFLGDRIPDPIPHMSGLGVYPPAMTHHAGEMFQAFETPFDIVGGASTAAKMKQSELMLHRWKAPPFGSWADVETRIFAVRPKCAVYHSDKSGSLIQLLRGQRNGKGREVAELTVGEFPMASAEISAGHAGSNPAPCPTCESESSANVTLDIPASVPEQTLTFSDTAASTRTIIVHPWGGQTPWESRNDSLSEIRQLSVRLRDFQTDAAKIRAVREELHDAGVIRLAYRFKKRKGWRKKRARSK